MLRHTLRLLGTTFALLALTAPLSPAASGAVPEAESDDGTVTWMVRPSDGVGEDGRSWVELELTAGQTAQEHLLIRNLSPFVVEFSLTAADGYFTDTGRFNMLTADQESKDAGTWITIQETVEVAPGADVVVPFTVAVPENATPGDHAAGVAAGIRSGGDEVGIESRVGFRVMTRVPGALAPAAAAQVGGEYQGTWNPFDPGQLTVDYTVSNTGNTRLSVIPRVTAVAMFGLVSFTMAGEEIVEFAPGESRAGRVTLPAVWPLLVYSADVTVEAKSVGPAAQATEVTSATGSAVVVAVPWPQLAVLALVALLMWWLWTDRRRLQRKLAEASAAASAPVGTDAREI